jgi:hypothetical protein
MDVLQQARDLADIYGITPEDNPDLFAELVQVLKNDAEGVDIGE